MSLSNHTPQSTQLHQNPLFPLPSPFQSSQHSHHSNPLPTTQPRIYRPLVSQLPSQKGLNGKTKVYLPWTSYTEARLILLVAALKPFSQWIPKHTLRLFPIPPSAYYNLPLHERTLSKPPIPIHDGSDFYKYTTSSYMSEIVQQESNLINLNTHAPHLLPSIFNHQSTLYNTALPSPPAQLNPTTPSNSSNLSLNQQPIHPTHPTAPPSPAKIELPPVILQPFVSYDLFTNGRIIGDHPTEHIPMKQILWAMHNGRGIIDPDHLKKYNLPCPDDFVEFKDAEDPEWVDWDAIKRGQSAYHRHSVQFIFCLQTVLLRGFVDRRLSDVLSLSGESLDVEKNFIRYSMTAHHVMYWITGDLHDPESSARNSLRQVRFLHTHARLRAKHYYEAEARKEAVLRYRIEVTLRECGECYTGGDNDNVYGDDYRSNQSDPTSPFMAKLDGNKPDSNNFDGIPAEILPDLHNSPSAQLSPLKSGRKLTPNEKIQLYREIEAECLDAIGIPLSQADLALVQLAFSIIAIFVSERDYGLIIPTQDHHDICHLWRYLGFRLGIEDRFNMCSSFLKQAGVFDEVIAILAVCGGSQRTSAYNLDTIRDLLDMCIASHNSATTKSPHESQLVVDGTAVPPFEMTITQGKQRSSGKISHYTSDKRSLLMTNVHSTLGYYLNNARKANAGNSNHLAQPRLSEQLHSHSGQQQLNQFNPDVLSHSSTLASIYHPAQHTTVSSPSSFNPSAIAVTTAQSAPSSPLLNPLSPHSKSLISLIHTLQFAQKPLYLPLLINPTAPSVTYQSSINAANALFHPWGLGNHMGQLMCQQNEGSQALGYSYLPYSNDAFHLMQQNAIFAPLSATLHFFVGCTCRHTRQHRKLINDMSIDNQVALRSLLSNPSSSSSPLSTELSTYLNYSSSTKEYTGGWCTRCCYDYYPMICNFVEIGRIWFHICLIYHQYTTKLINEYETFVKSAKNGNNKFLNQNQQQPQYPTIKYTFTQQELDFIQVVGESGIFHPFYTMLAVELVDELPLHIKTYIFHHLQYITSPPDSLVKQCAPGVPVEFQDTSIPANNSTVNQQQSRNTTHPSDSPSSGTGTDFFSQFQSQRKYLFDLTPFQAQNDNLLVNGVVFKIGAIFGLQFHSPAWISSSNRQNQSPTTSFFTNNQTWLPLASTAKKINYESTVIQWMKHAARAQTHVTDTDTDASSHIIDVERLFDEPQSKTQTQRQQKRQHGMCPMLGHSYAMIGGASSSTTAHGDKTATQKDNNNTKVAVSGTLSKLTATPHETDHFLHQLQRYSGLYDETIDGVVESRMEVLLHGFNVESVVRDTFNEFDYDYNTFNYTPSRPDSTTVSNLVSAAKSHHKGCPAMKSQPLTQPPAQSIQTGCLVMQTQPSTSTQPPTQSTSQRPIQHTAPKSCPVTHPTPSPSPSPDRPNISLSLLSSSVLRRLLHTFNLTDPSDPYTNGEHMVFTTGLRDAFHTQILSLLPPPETIMIVSKLDPPAPLPNFLDPTTYTPEPLLLDALDQLKIAIPPPAPSDQDKEHFVIPDMLLSATPFPTNYLPAVLGVTGDDRSKTFDDFEKYYKQTVLLENVLNLLDSHQDKPARLPYTPTAILTILSNLSANNLYSSAHFPALSLLPFLAKKRSTFTHALVGNMIYSMFIKLARLRNRYVITRLGGSNLGSWDFPEHHPIRLLYRISSVANEISLFAERMHRENIRNSGELGYKPSNSPFSVGGLLLPFITPFRLFKWTQDVLSFLAQQLYFGEESFDSDNLLNPHSILFQDGPRDYGGGVATNKSHSVLTMFHQFFSNQMRAFGGYFSNLLSSQTIVAPETQPHDLNINSRNADSSIFSNTIVDSEPIVVGQDIAYPLHTYGQAIPTPGDEAYELYLSQTAQMPTAPQSLHPHYPHQHLQLSTDSPFHNNIQSPLADNSVPAVPLSALSSLHPSPAVSPLCSSIFAPSPYLAPNQVLLTPNPDHPPTLAPFTLFHHHSETLNQVTLLDHHHDTLNHQDYLASFDENSDPPTPTNQQAQRFGPSLINYGPTSNLPNTAISMIQQQPQSSPTRIPTPPIQPYLQSNPNNTATDSVKAPAQPISLTQNALVSNMSSIDTFSNLPSSSSFLPPIGSISDIPVVNTHITADSTIAQAEHGNGTALQAETTPNTILINPIDLSTRPTPNNSPSCTGLSSLTLSHQVSTSPPQSESQNHLVFPGDQISSNFNTNPPSPSASPVSTITSLPSTPQNVTLTVPTIVPTTAAPPLQSSAPVSTQQPQQPQKTLLSQASRQDVYNAFSKGDNRNTISLGEFYADFNRYRSMVNNLSQEIDEYVGFLQSYRKYQIFEYKWRLSREEQHQHAQLARKALIQENVQNHYNLGQKSPSEKCSINSPVSTPLSQSSPIFGPASPQSARMFPDGPPTVASDHGVVTLSSQPFNQSLTTTTDDIPSNNNHPDNLSCNLEDISEVEARRASLPPIQGANATGEDGDCTIEAQARRSSLPPLPRADFNLNNSDNSPTQKTSTTTPLNSLPRVQILQIPPTPSETVSATPPNPPLSPTSQTISIHHPIASTNNSVGPQDVQCSSVYSSQLPSTQPQTQPQLSSSTLDLLQSYSDLSRPLTSALTGFTIETPATAKSALLFQDFNADVLFSSKAEEKNEKIDYLKTYFVQLTHSLGNSVDNYTSAHRLPCSPKSRTQATSSSPLPQSSVQFNVSHNQSPSHDIPLSPLQPLTMNCVNTTNSPATNQSPASIPPCDSLSSLTLPSNYYSMLLNVVVGKGPSGMADKSATLGLFDVVAHYTWHLPTNNTPNSSVNASHPPTNSSQSTTHLQIFPTLPNTVSKYQPSACLHCEHLLKLKRQLINNKAIPYHNHTYAHPSQTPIIAHPTQIINSPTDLLLGLLTGIHPYQSLPQDVIQKVHKICARSETVSSVSIHPFQLLVYSTLTQNQQTASDVLFGQQLSTSILTPILYGNASVNNKSHVRVALKRVINMYNARIRAIALQIHHTKDDIAKCEAKVQMLGNNPAFSRNSHLIPKSTSSQSAQNVIPNYYSAQSNQIVQVSTPPMSPFAILHHQAYLGHDNHNNNNNNNNVALSTDLSVQSYVSDVDIANPAAGPVNISNTANNAVPIDNGNYPLTFHHHDTITDTLRYNNIPSTTNQPHAPLSRPPTDNVNINGNGDDENPTEGLLSFENWSKNFVMNALNSSNPTPLILMSNTQIAPDQSTTQTQTQTQAPAIVPLHNIDLISKTKSTPSLIPNQPDATQSQSQQFFSPFSLPVRTSSNDTASVGFSFSPHHPYASPSSFQSSTTPTTHMLPPSSLPTPSNLQYALTTLSIQLDQLSDEYDTLSMVYNQMRQCIEAIPLINFKSESKFDVSDFLIFFQYSPSSLPTEVVQSIITAINQREKLLHDKKVKRIQQQHKQQSLPFSPFFDGLSTTGKKFQLIAQNNYGWPLGSTLHFIPYLYFNAKRVERLQNPKFSSPTSPLHTSSLLNPPTRDLHRRRTPSVIFIPNALASAPFASSTTDLLSPVSTDLVYTQRDGTDGGRSARSNTNSPFHHPASLPFSPSPGLSNGLYAYDDVLSVTPTEIENGGFGDAHSAQNATNDQHSVKANENDDILESQPSSLYPSPQSVCGALPFTNNSHTPPPPQQQQQDELTRGRSTSSAQLSYPFNTDSPLQMMAQNKMPSSSSSSPNAHYTNIVHVSPNYLVRPLSNQVTPQFTPNPTPLSQLTINSNHSLFPSTSHPRPNSVDSATRSAVNPYVVKVKLNTTLNHGLSIKHITSTRSHQFGYEYLLIPPSQPLLVADPDQTSTGTTSNSFSTPLNSNPNTTPTSLVNHSSTIKLKKPTDLITHPSNHFIVPSLTSLYHSSSPACHTAGFLANTAVHDSVHEFYSNSAAHSHTPIVSFSSGDKLISESLKLSVTLPLPNSTSPQNREIILASHSYNIYAYVALLSVQSFQQLSHQQPFVELVNNAAVQLVSSDHAQIHQANDHSDSPQLVMDYILQTHLYIPSDTRYRHNYFLNSLTSTISHKSPHFRQFLSQFSHHHIKTTLPTPQCINAFQHIGQLSREFASSEFFWTTHFSLLLAHISYHKSVQPAHQTTSSMHSALYAPNLTFLPLPQNLGSITTRTNLSYNFTLIDALNVEITQKATINHVYHYFFKLASIPLIAPQTISLHHPLLEKRPQLTFFDLYRPLMILATIFTYKSSLDHLLPLYFQYLHRNNPHLHFQQPLQQISSSNQQTSPNTTIQLSNQSTPLASSTSLKSTLSLHELLDFLHDQLQLSESNSTNHPSLPHQSPHPSSTAEPDQLQSSGSPCAAMNSDESIQQQEQQPQEQRPQPQSPSLTSSALATIATGTSALVSKIASAFYTVEQPPLADGN